MGRDLFIKPNCSRLDLEAMRATLKRQIVGLAAELEGLQIQLDWIEHALAQLDDEP